MDLWWQATRTAIVLGVKDLDGGRRTDVSATVDLGAVDQWRTPPLRTTRLDNWWWFLPDRESGFLDSVGGNLRFLIDVVSFGAAK